MQRRTPDAIRSRVAAALESVSHISLAVSFLVAGPLVGWLGPRGTYVFGGVVSLFAIVAAVPVFRARNEADVGTTGPARDGETPAALVLGDSTEPAYSAGETETTASTR